MWSSNDMSVSHRKSFDNNTNDSEPWLPFSQSTTLFELCIDDLLFTAQTTLLTIVTGCVGSGKTSLLLALLHEMPFLSGELQSNANVISYAAQSPWIRNASVKSTHTLLPENIILSQDDMIRYNAIIAACVLDVDFASWHNGDLTILREIEQQLVEDNKQG